MIDDNKKACPHCAKAEKTAEEKHDCCGEHKDKTSGESHACCGEHKDKTSGESHSCCSSGQSGKKNKAGGCCGSTADKGKVYQYVILAVSLAALIVSFISPFRQHEILRWFDFGYIAVILCGIPIFKAAIESLAKGKITSSLLISLSITACIVLEVLTLTHVLHTDSHAHSNIFAAGEVAWLMALGGMIEEFTVKKARAGIESLVSLTPTVAKFRVGDSIIEKPLSEVVPGDEVVVLAGDVISVDGEIISGITAVNQAVMTGESVPVDKTPGDTVFGGTMNVSGAITVKVLRPASEMAVNKLRALVEEAEGKKAPISKIADKWASIIVPAAVVLAIIVFMVSYFVLAKGNLPESILRGVTMLVVFCPCALALATPTAVAAGLGASARRGILVKSGEALEALAKVKTVAFDKTGTLTHGRLTVDSIFDLTDKTGRLEAIAGACESLSTHPIAKAIVLHCSKGVKFPEISNSQSLAGSGVSGIVSGKKVMVVKWQDAEKNCDNAERALSAANQYLSEGKTLAAVIEDGKLLGIIALTDEIKEGAADCARELKSIGVGAVMLTGDNNLAAKHIADVVGIDYMAQLMPEDKLAAIEKLKQRGKVCMVGDGVNDAPALAAADTSIAMAALGSDVAIETADIALMTGDIKKVSALVKFSRRVLRTIKLNIIISLTISFIAVFLSSFGVLNPITGALVHNISSILVVTNSALLLLWGRQKNSADKVKNSLQK